jgi:predicted aspartyl protease
MTPYNRAFDPPAPVITIQVSPLNQSELTTTVDCLVDTGADLSLIPQRLAEEFNLAPEGVIIVEGFDGERQQLYLFAVDIVVEEFRLDGLEVTAYPTDHAILGRDILNRFRLLLDGPAQMLEFL